MSRLDTNSIYTLEDARKAALKVIDSYLEPFTSINDEETTLLFGADISAIEDCIAGEVDDETWDAISTYLDRVRDEMDGALDSIQIAINKARDRVESMKAKEKSDE